ncbi:tetratricopeptide repeat-containing sensor histidine kinase [Fulvivirga imtechensis]|nr:tetratricopeptide repeat protein [Fulvivirga imtechensis]
MNKSHLYLIRATRYVSVLLFLINGSLQAQSTNSERIDSLKKELQNAKDIESEIDILNELSYSALDIDYNLSQEYSQKALSLSEKNGYDIGKATALYNMSLHAFQLGSYDSTYVYCEQALIISQESGNKVLSAKIMNRLGVTYQTLGNRKRALSNYLSALRIFEDDNDKGGVAAVCNKLGIFYETQQEYDKALKYYQKALDYHQRIGGPRQQAIVINNIGVVYHKTQQLDKALEHYQRSKALLIKTGDSINISIRDINIGKIHKEWKDYDSASVYLTSALKACEASGNKNLQLYTLNQLGETKIGKSEFDSAFTYLQRALRLAAETGEKEVAPEIYRNLSNTYYGLRRFKDAYDANVAYHHLKDSLFNIERSHDIAEIEAKYRVSEKEKEISLLKSQSEKKDIILYSSITGLVLFLILIILIVNDYKRRSRASRLINEKNEELNRQRISELLKEQQLKSIHGKLEGQENERKRIAKELHDGIGGTLASIKLNLQKVKDERLTDLINDIDKACEEVRTVSHNLAPPAFFNSALTDIIRDFVEKSLNRHKINVNLEFYPEKTLNNISTDLQVDLYRIVQELVTNITKHAEASHVEITITAHDHIINLIVEDDGKGYIPSQNIKGIGLQNISSRVNALNGIIHFDSKPGRGTAVSIDIPYQHWNFSTRQVELRDGINA